MCLKNSKCAILTDHMTPTQKFLNFRGMKQSISVFCRIKPVDKRKEGNYEISTWEENEKKEKLEIQIPRLDEAGVVNNKQG